MKNISTYLLATAVALASFSSCKKDDAIPAKTLQLTVESKQVVFPDSAATLTLSKQGTQLTLAARATDAARTSIQIIAYSSGASLEAPGSYSQNPASADGARSTYGYLVLANFTTDCGIVMYPNNYITYNTGVIPIGLPDTMPNFHLTVKTVDTGTHTMSGTFTGSYWKGCDKVEITDGQFNLPYTVQP